MSGQAFAVQVFACFRRGDDEAGQMQVRLRGRAFFLDEVGHAVEQAALRAVVPVIQVEVVEIRAVVATERHAASQVAVRCAQKLIHEPMYRHHTQTQIVDQAQIGGKRDVIVGRVIVAFDIDGVVGKNGDAHGALRDLEGSVH